MLDDLLEKVIIELLEPKQLKEAGRTVDPKYYQYHKVVSHPLEKCIMFRKHIMKPANDERIILDLNNTTETNHISTNGSVFHHLSGKNILDFRVE